ncbi:hypothetical protein [Flavobacterium daejeonense]|uniref:hypothetical protein n=1 Tax=Flavobacterium daejeonense TaxID=350893 RepID=UPI00047D141C|nr:hypothetical protein [Flavobacterium daejeonense]
MATIKELHQKRESLLIQYASLKYDFDEFIKNPVETVSIDQIKHQLDFTFGEIERNDNKIKQLVVAEMELLKASLKNMEMLVRLQNDKALELPKYHYSMFK